MRSPEQFERWSQVVLLAFNQLVLARKEAAPSLYPWERCHAALTPRQVRRGMFLLLCKVGTPARPPRQRGIPRGRAKGTLVKRAKRYPVTPKHRSKVPAGKGKQQKTGKSGSNVA